MTNKTWIDPNKKTLQDGIPEEAEQQNHASVLAAQRAVNNNNTSDSKPEEREDPVMDSAPNNPKPDKAPKQEGDNPKDLDRPEEKWNDQTPEK